MWKYNHFQIDTLIGKWPHQSRASKGSSNPLRLLVLTRDKQNKQTLSELGSVLLPFKAFQGMMKPKDFTDVFPFYCFAYSALSGSDELNIYTDEGAFYGVCPSSG